MKHPTIQDIRLILSVLKSELQMHADRIDKRLLRAMQDVADLTAKQTGRAVHNKLVNIHNLLTEHVDGYKDLEPLGTDFWNKMHE